MEFLFDPFGIKKKRQAEQEAREALERQQSIQREEENRRYRKERREQKRKEWLGKGLTGETNPFVNEIQEKGTVNSIDINEVEELASDEKLLDGNLVDCLRRNQDQVNQIGLDHRTLADPLQRIYFDLMDAREARQESTVDFEYLGNKYKVKSYYLNSIKESPFLGKSHEGMDYLNANCVGGAIQVFDETGKEFSFQPILVHMIRDFGFYGKGAPKEIVDFFKINSKLSSEGDGNL